MVLECSRAEREGSGGRGSVKATAPPTVALTLPLPPGLHRSDVEPNPLSERQLRTPVDGVRLAPHVRLPGIRARLAAAAGVFLAAEGAADLGPRSAEIDVG